MALMDWIREEGGIQLIDTLWALVQNEMVNNSKWAEIGRMHSPQAWKAFLDKVESFDENEIASLGELVKFLTQAPRDIQDPIWTRWQTTIKTGKIFLENYMSVYFLVVGVKTKYKVDSHPWKLAYTLIS